MNKEYVWAFDESALAAGLDGAFSLEYHVPDSKMKVKPDLLVGSRVWLVVRSGNENFLYAVLNPSIVELYQQGKYKDDFLLRCEPFSSVRFLPRQESRIPWTLSFQGGEDIRECTDQELSTFVGMIKKNHRVGFSATPRAVLESVPQTAFADIEHAVPDQLMSTLRVVSFGDVSRSRSLPNSISALGGIVLAILKSTHPHLKEPDVVKLLAALDPISETEEVMKSSGDILRVLSSLPPVVDTFLEEIDTDKISPRTFVAKAPDSSLEWLDKTNDAEQAHEQILKDLVLYLKSKGFKVYKTRSFDLFAKKADLQYLWEIKSANNFNSVSQGEKGIVQLLRYSTALMDGDENNIKFLLLLQDSGQHAVHRYLSKMAGRAGSELWLYNEDKDWPNRISSLEVSAFPGLQ